MRRIGMRPTTLALLAAAASAGGLLGAQPASAHAQLLSSDPRADSTVTTQLDEITLTFNELVRGNFSTVVVTGPDRVRHGAGQPQVLDKRVHLPVEPVRSGGYRVAYRVVSADGHPIEGQFRFTVALPEALEPTAPSSNPPSASDGPSVSPAVQTAAGDTGAGPGLRGAVAAGLGVALVAGFVLLRRRHRTDGIDQ